MPPRLAEGVQLIGEYEGSGFREPPSLVRRGDGQVIQLTPLLYAVAERADGRRSLQEIADEVSADIRRQLSADNVRFLVDEKLRPLGVLSGTDGSSAPVRKLDPLLALKFRAAIVPERVSQVLARAFSPLFLPPVVAGVLAALVAADAWLFLRHGVAQAMRQSLYNPGTFLLIFAMVVLSAALHEVGHAAACHYGGGRPGKMGCGLYLAWPAFYTDVTDAYRLGRRARLRTDLGGVYFNAVVVVATVGAYLLTGFEPLLLLVVVQHLEIAHQLLPVVRLDGYYIVADLTGVPDLFARIKPILRSLLPGREADERVTALKPWVRVAVSVWVLVVVPLLLVQVLVILVHLPRILGTAWDSAQRQAGLVRRALDEADAIAAAVGVLQLVLLSLPVLGILLMLVRLARRVGGWAWTRTEGRPALRTASVAGALGVATLLAAAWLPERNYAPIRRGERGTLVDGVMAVRRLPSGRAPLVSHERARDAVAPASGGGGEQPASTTTSSTSSTPPTSAASTSAGSSASTPSTPGETAPPTTAGSSPSVARLPGTTGAGEAERTPTTVGSGATTPGGVTSTTTTTPPPEQSTTTTTTIRSTTTTNPTSAP